MFLTQPQSVSPVSGSSLGIFPLFAALCRVHSAEAAQGDHPDLLQPLEMRIVILLPSRVRIRIFCAKKR